MDQQDQQQESLFGLSIDPHSRMHLAETAKWTRFLAIAGFVFIGLMILYGIVMSVVVSKITPRYSSEFESPYSSTIGFVLIIYTIIFGVIYFFPCLFTLRFSNYMKEALNTNDQEKLNSAFQNLKIAARYLGILTIIGLALFAIVILIALATGLMSGLK